MSKNFRTALLSFLCLTLVTAALSPSVTIAQRRNPKLPAPSTSGSTEVIDDPETDQVQATIQQGEHPIVPASVGSAASGNDTATAAAVDPNQTEINVKNADIAAVVRIFSKKTKRNYILDERVKGKVSIYLPGKVTAEESLKILDSVLALKGFTSVPLGENLWKIVPSKEAKQSTIPTLKDDKDSSKSNAVVTRILNLKYIAADEAREIIAQLVSADGLVSAYGGTNALLLIDYEDNVARLVDILNTVDVPFSNREMTIIPIKNAEAPEIQKKLAELLGLGESKSSEKSTAPDGQDLLKARANPIPPAGGVPQGGMIPVGGEGQPGGGAAGGSAVKTRTLEPKVIADERTNSILVVADDETTARIRALISQLDSEVDLSGHRFYVYKCQHAKADELAQTLAGLMGGEASGGNQTTGSNALDLGGSDGINNNSKNRGGNFDKTQSRLSGQSRTPGRSRSENQAASGPATSVQFGKDMSITADKATNTLVINAGKSEYEKIKSLLQQLDTKRRQVLVEAMLLEVRVDDQASYGFDWLSSGGGADGGVVAKSDFGSSGNNLATLFSNPTSISNFSVAAASKGSLSLPGGITIPTQSVLLTAAQGNSNINVLSAPNILTTDNEQAEIVVGQNVPFLASRSTSTQNLDNTFNQIDRQDVGITLRLTPQISSQSFVNLKLFTEVSAIVPGASDLGPTTSVRTSETNVIAKDGQMIVIGGLMSDSKTDSDNGVPFLKDIPVLGWAFKNTSAQNQKTNLLIFITPRIVQDQYDLRDIAHDEKSVMADEIARRNIHPDRADVLQNKNFDKVTDVNDYDGVKATTILPPESATPVANPSVGAVTKEFTGDTPGVIQLKVQPKIPSKSSVQSALTKQNTSAVVTEHKNRFLLMRVEGVEHQDDAARAPFEGVKNEDGSPAIVGIEVPEGSSADALKFFTPGSMYQYQTGKTIVPVTILSAHGDRLAAQSASGAKSISWYTLSPFEVMNLGKSPWKKQ